MSLDSTDFFKGVPPEFASYFEYIRSLKFDDKPDYSFLKRLFRERFMKENFEFDYVYDWLLIP